MEFLASILATIGPVGIITLVCTIWFGQVVSVQMTISTRRR
jgi:hypothetical protein